MSQHQTTDLVIDPFTTSGQQLAVILNRLHGAYATMHSGAARPPYAKPGTVWLDNTTPPGKLMWYDGTTDQPLGASIQGGTAGQFLRKKSATDGDIEWVNAPGGVPAGSIVAFVHGYFANAMNGSYSAVTGNTIADINALVKPDGWQVCDGTALNDPASPIFNGAGRHLPNLTDSRFLQGSAAAGSVGGDNNISHTHSVTIPALAVRGHTLSAAEMPKHRHGVPTYRAASGAAPTNKPTSTSGTAIIGNGTAAFTLYVGSSHSHSHTTTAKAATTAAKAVDNRPKFLSCFYIVKVK